jgi:hypothetical protein
MFKAPICNPRKGVVTIVLTDDLAPRHTVRVLRHSTKITGEGAWLRNWR